MDLDFTDDQMEASDVGLFEDPTFEPELLSCWSMGPLQVCGKIVSGDRVEVEIKLAGIRIGSGTLSAGNSQICASGNVALFKVKVCVRADFPGKTVWVEGQLCTRKFPSGWSCRGFRTKLISW